MCFKMKMPANIQMPQVNTTARDIVPEREAKAPESPIFGDDKDSSTSFVDIAKKKGVGALQIKPNTYNPVNNYYNK